MQILLSVHKRMYVSSENSAATPLPVINIKLIKVSNRKKVLKWNDWDQIKWQETVEFVLLQAINVS